MVKKNTLNVWIDFIYFLLSIFVAFVLPGFLISYLPFIITGGKVVIVIIFGILFYIGLQDIKNEVLIFLLPLGLINKLNIYNIEWKNEEFDKFVGSDLLELYRDSCVLLEQNKKEGQIFPALSDYSIIILPIAKVYEGILKKILVEAEIIGEEEIRINPGINVGHYFNPVGNNKIFNHIKDHARDRVVPHIIYATYQECRNQILHYDPHKDNRIKNIEDVEFYVKRIMHAIDKAYETFKK